MSDEYGCAALSVIFAKQHVSPSWFAKCREPTRRSLSTRLRSLRMAGGARRETAEAAGWRLSTGHAVADLYLHA